MSTLLEELREAYKAETGTNPGRIKLPSKVDFVRAENGSVRITLTKEQVVNNMQANDAAFEGWATVLHRWLKGTPKTVLDWTAPEKSQLVLKDGSLTTKGQHYQRFLYRAYRMHSTYSWFEISDSARAYISQSILLHQSGPFRLNIAANEGKEPSTIREGSEVWIERHIHKDNRAIQQESAIDSLYFQLPVGVFRGKVSRKNRVFTGSRSAIDLWGVNSGKGIVKIFELKAPKKKEVGIVTELMFYSNVLLDTMGPDALIQIDGIGAYMLPSRGSIEAFDILKKSQTLEAVFLVEKMHPLLDSKVLDILNNQNKDHKIKYWHLSLDKVYKGAK